MEGLTCDSGRCHSKVSGFPLARILVCASRGHAACWQNLRTHLSCGPLFALFGLNIGHCRAFSFG